MIKANIDTLKPKNEPKSVMPAEGWHPEKIMTAYTPYPSPSLVLRGLSGL